MTTARSFPAWAGWLAHRLPIALASGALLLLMLLTFADVMLRSTLNAPIQFAADLTRLLMAITVFSAMPLLSHQGNQISVDLLDGIFARLRISRLVDIAVSVFCGGILIWPALRVYDLAQRSKSYGDRMEYLKLPVHYVEWFVALMTMVTALALLWRAVMLIIAPHELEKTHD
ncbi:MAG: C4-dicarboxylate ABC transporter permease [Rhodobacterales bacterium]|nr:MAG: C4-dicarboxylate ABC transporter permease [Rhodobacterales bacterium]